MNTNNQCHYPGFILGYQLISSCFEAFKLTTRHKTWYFSLQYQPTSDSEYSYRKKKPSYFVKNILKTQRGIVNTLCALPSQIYHCRDRLCLTWRRFENNTLSDDRTTSELQPNNVDGRASNTVRPNTLVIRTCIYYIYLYRSTQTNSRQLCLSHFPLTIICV